MIERTILGLALAGSISLAIPGLAHAQAVSFVASYGNDANLCTRAQPCRTLQRGHNLTTAGGELQILDSGEYGPGVAITKSITISAVGVSATIGVSGASGITIGAGTIVVLRGLHLSALSQAAHLGIAVSNSATLYLEDCIVEGFSETGISGADARQFAEGVVARYNQDYGLKGRNWLIRDSSFEGSGHRLYYPGAGASVRFSTVVNSRATKNKAGFNGDRTTVFNSVAEQNETGILSPLFDGNGQSLAIVERSRVAGNQCGVCTELFDPVYYSRAIVANSFVTDNSIGVRYTISAPTVTSLGNNTISGNDQDGSAGLVQISPR